MSLRAQFEQVGQVLHCRFDGIESTPHADVSRGASSGECFLEMPEGWKLAEAHPDLVGLAALLMIDTSVEHSLTLSQPVSQPFAECVEAAAGVCVRPIDGAISPRPCPPRGRPGLAFSGGVDSTAALLLLEDETPLVYLKREEPAGTKTQYQTAGGIKACQQMRNRGREVHVVPSDLELLRTSVGFMTDWTCGVPVVLLADFLDLNALVVGINLTDSFGLSKGGYIDPSENPIFQHWSPLFDSTGLSLHLPTAGLSAAATAKLLSGSGYEDVSCSCVRGPDGTPCMACPKCVRKESIWRLQKADYLDDTDVEEFLKMRKIRLHLRQRPLPYTHDFAYICEHFVGRNRTMALLRGAVGGRPRKMEWMEKWYSPSAVLLSRQHKSFALARIRRLLQVMTPEEDLRVRTWDKPGRVTEARRSFYAWRLRRSLQPSRTTRILRSVVRRAARMRKGAMSL